LNDVKQLGLDFSHQDNLEKIIHRERIEWEAWIESAPSYSELRKRLAKRGYRNTPMSDKSEVLTRRMNVRKEAIERLPQQRTMMRRGSR